MKLSKIVAIAVLSLAAMSVVAQQPKEDNRPPVVTYTLVGKELSDYSIAKKKYDAAKTVYDSSKSALDDADKSLKSVTSAVQLAHSPNYDHGGEYLHALYWCWDLQYSDGRIQHGIVVYDLTNTAGCPSTMESAPVTADVFGTLYINDNFGPHSFSPRTNASTVTGIK